MLGPHTRGWYEADLMGMCVTAKSIISGVLAVVLGVSAGAGAAHAAPLASAAYVAPEDGDSDAERRARLNARMAEMVRSGEGARLAQPEARPPSRTARTRRSSTAAADPVPVLPPPATPVTTTASDGSWVVGAAPSRSTAWTVTSPVGNRSARRSNGAYYTPPRLDLTTAPIVPTDPVECLAQAVYYEARNESGEGQAAVAEVVMNRTRSGVFPQSVCGVVYQRNSRTCQFTFTCDGAIGRSSIDRQKWARAEQIARDVYEGRSLALLPTNSLNYHANYVSPSWGRRLQRVRQIGAHIFYGAALAGGGSPPGAQPAPTVIQPVVSGLVFVRNVGLDRVYDTLRGAVASAPSTPQTSSLAGQQ